MSQTPTILSIKWGTAFTADDVNRLHRAARARTTGPLRFICLTDNAAGLDPQIKPRDIPDIGLTAQDWKRPGVWRKLSLYAPALHDLGRVLFVDLDMMIVGSLDPFFDVTAGVVFLNMGDSWRRDPTSDHTEGGTAIFSFDPRVEHGILQTFQADPHRYMDSFHNEQDFAFAHASATALWDEGRVLSFKRHLCHRNGAGLVRAIRPVPSGASVIAFHGDPRPADVKNKALWGPFPHLHAGTPALIRDYWNRFSDPAE